MCWCAHVFVLFLVVSKALAEGGNPHFCSQLIINSTDPGLRVSREVNLLDIGHRREYKELHCCFVNYDTIEWYKDGVRLFVANTSAKTTFKFISSEDGNRTIATHILSAHDNGTYTCIARRGEKSIERSITLSVDIRNQYEESPKLITELKDVYAWAGDTRRFCCEAFVGYGPQTLHNSAVMWLPSKANDTDKREYYSRMNAEILGALLTFDPVKKEDFGTYTCKVTNSYGIILHNVTLFEGDDPNTKVRTTYKLTLIILAIFTTTVLLITAAVSHWQLELKLLWKDRVGALEDDDDRLYDVFICYDKHDADFVNEKLVPILEDQCDYSCFVWERDTLAGELIPEAYAQRVRQSRRFLMVLSPTLANNTWCIFALYGAIDAMLNSYSRIICVLLQDIDWDTVIVADGQSDNCTLRQVTRVVRIIRWDPRPTLCRKFWHQLRYTLPPRRSLPLTIKVAAASLQSSQEALVDQSD